MKSSALKSALGILVAAIGLSAQTIHLSANIPFEFRVGETVMPAGKYAIATDSGVIQLRTTEGQRKGMFVLARSEQSLNPKPASLVFSRYGDSYFLSTVWGPYATSGLRLQPSRLEKELSNRVRFPTATEIAAHTNAR